MKLKYGSILTLREGKFGKPKLVQVATKDCSGEYLIRMIEIPWKNRGAIRNPIKSRGFFMRKEHIPKFYEIKPVGYGTGKLLDTPPHKTFLDHFKSKYLKVNP